MKHPVGYKNSTLKAGVKETFIPFLDKIPFHADDFAVACVSIYIPFYRKIPSPAQ